MFLSSNIYLMKLVAKVFYVLLESEIGPMNSETRRKILVQTKKESMCLPCLATVGSVSHFLSLHLCSLAVIIHLSHLRKPKHRE